MPKPLTQKQFDFLHELIQKKDLQGLPPLQKAFLSEPANIQRLNKDQASNAIGALLNCPNKQGTTGATGNGKNGGTEFDDKVPAGRYFIVDPTDSVEKFIQVNKPSPPSKWAGYTFVSVQASDDLFPVKDREHRTEILREISKDPVTAMNEYGIKLGHCGRCGRTLTNRDSRLRGVGPICAAHLRRDFGIELTADDLTNLLSLQGD